ncbi:hypothetical protein [Agrobacterium tumefaciens]|jgi:hypothetical protein|uniref:hypothetical protein n=1 Tax=Agrobacterium tumefaciens TaxID=358 RepID=UPI001CBDB1FD|nr:hypothetical protein [Agrobacterium tumefaciens]
MVPLRETFASSDASAIAGLDKAYNAGRLGQVSKPYWRKGANDKAYFVRGDIHLSPSISISAQRLPSWACWKARLPVGARAVVDGRENAKLIAGNYKSFLDALEAAPLAYYQGQPDDLPNAMRSRTTCWP